MILRLTVCDGIPWRQIRSPEVKSSSVLLLVCLYNYTGFALDEWKLFFKDGG